MANVNAWTEEAMRRLWVRLGDIYGKRFFAEYGDTPNVTWAESIRRLSYEQAAAALETCRTIGDQYPPTLSQFIGRAKQSSAPYHKPYRGLPKPPSDPAVAERNRAQLRARSQSVLRPGRRSVMLPGESYAGYVIAKGKAVAEGVSETEFDLRRLEANGWTRERERDFEQSYAHTRRT